MTIDLSKWGPTTIALIALVFIVVVGGIVCAIVSDAALHRYLELATVGWKYALALAGLAVGRGVHLGLQAVGQSRDPSLNADPSDRAGADDQPASVAA